MLPAIARRILSTRGSILILRATTSLDLRVILERIIESEINPMVIELRYHEVEL